MEFFSVGVFLVLALILIFLVLFLRSDCDLSLSFYEKFGKSVDSLKGKVIWIVGSSSGIGECLAYELAPHGCKLILSARREDELKRVKDECLKRGKVSDDDLYILPLDVTATSSHQTTVDAAVKRFGQVDVLVNNAGRTQRAKWETIELDVDRQLFDVNVFGMILLTRRLLSNWLSKSGGHVITMSSAAGKMGVPGSASYTASKFALHGYMESLRWEKSRNKIDVTMVCPGPVVSNLLQSGFTAKAGETTGENWKMKGRMPTERCAYLTAVAIANKLDEVWIAPNPYLAAFYGMQYFPTITRKLGSIVGAKLILKSRDGETMKAK